MLVFQQERKATVTFKLKMIHSIKKRNYLLKYNTFRTMHNFKILITYLNTGVQGGVVNLSPNAKLAS